MLPRRSVPGSLVSLHGSVIQAIGEATMGTANRTDPLAEFELRDGNRVLYILYNVEDEEVILLIVGRKVGDTSRRMR
jgi:hypothetical protein